MWEWFWFTLPWEIKLALFAMVAAAGIVAASLVFGFERVRRYILPVGAAVAALAFWNKAQQQGWKAREKKELAAANKAIDRAVEARERANEFNADPNNLRKDDGHRRD